MWYISVTDVLQWSRSGREARSQLFGCGSEAFGRGSVADNCWKIYLRKVRRLAEGVCLSSCSYAARCAGSPRMVRTSLDISAKRLR